MTKTTYLVTAALPYGNGPIHIGHLVEYTLADFYVRQLRLDGQEAFYICADDAHGTPIELAAEREGVSPEELTARVQAGHQSDFQRFLVDFDCYHSTHSTENRELVELIYTHLCSRGHIVTRTVEQLYDPLAGRFLADRFVTGTCPRCDAPEQYGDGCEKCGATYDALDLREPQSAITGTRPEVRRSEHLFFELPPLADRLQAFLGQVTITEAMANKLDEWFASGLRSWDISRDAPYFGFPIPDQPGKFFYVWVDAPVGYLASFKHHCDRSGINFWAVLNDPGLRIEHVIGKDIAYFHGIYWPAMLMGSDLPLPKALHCHGFLTVEGRKMSKSRGTLISARALADVIAPEAFRYFVFSQLDDGIEDIDLSFEALSNLVNSDLVGKIINLGARASGVLQRISGGKLPVTLAAAPTYAACLAQLEKAGQAMRARKFRQARRLIVEVADEANRQFSEAAPWQLIKGGPADRALAARHCAQALLAFRAIMVTLQPIVPALSQRALDLFDDGRARDGSYLLGRAQIPEFPQMFERVSHDSLTALISTLADEPQD